MLKTIEEIRITNLIFLLQPTGSARNIAHQLNLEPSYISQIKTGREGFSSDMARAIEKAAGMEYGWMDHAHGDTPPTLCALCCSKEGVTEELASRIGALGATELISFITKVLVTHSAN